MNVTAQNTDTLSRILAERFKAESKHLYLVGGFIRDEMLGQSDADLDFATDALPRETVAILEGTGGSIYRVGEKFGTIGLALPGHTIEITTYRSQETYRAGSRKPEVRFGQTLEEDLTRRDFTINAMARDPLTGTLVDPAGGKSDLTAGLIRAVGNPAERFREDPLRLLRAVRFATRFHFAIEPDTWRALCQTAPSLGHISRERIRDEYSKILTGPDPLRGLTLLRDGELLANSVPGLLELMAMPDHGPRHPLSLWDHVMLVLRGVPESLPLRWAALLHDIGKPSTRTHEPDGRPRFFHHEKVGAAMAQRILSDLRYDNELVASVILLVETHMQLHSYDPEWSDGAVRRLMLRLGPLLESAIQLARADAAGHATSGESHGAPKFDHLEQRIHQLGLQRVHELKSPLSGNDLMERYCRPGGPWVGEIKNALLHDVLEGILVPGDREAAWQRADELVRSGV